MQFGLDIMKLITAPLSGAELSTLGQAGLWSDLAVLAKNQSWWYRRTVWLVEGVLTERIGNWRTAYGSLDAIGFGFEFDRNHDYTNPIVVSVLLEIGASPGRHTLNHICQLGSSKSAKLLLDIPRVSAKGEDTHNLSQAVLREEEAM